MTLPIPSPDTLAQRFAAALAQQEFTASDGSVVRLDATAPQTLEQALSIISALDLYQVYLYARDIGLELIVSTSTESGLLPNHAEIWGVPREGASSAIGNFIFATSQAVDIPVGTLITIDGSTQWAVTTATDIAANATSSVPVMATSAGTAGNLAANTAAQLVSPIAGVVSIVSDQSGIAGGAAIESAEAWKARIISVIQNRSSGGTLANYETWALAAGAAYVYAVRAYDGPGTVGIIVAMAGPTAPTPAQIVAIQTYIDSVRPVRGNATVHSAQIVPQNMTIALNPDTSAAQAAVQAALAPVFLAAGIGGKNTSGRITIAALEAAIAAVAGTQNTLIAPANDLAVPTNQLTVLGTITWQAGGA